MKILHIVESCGGGVARHIIDLSKKLLARGHEVTVVYSSVRAEDYFLENLKPLPGIRMYEIPMQRAVSVSDFWSWRQLVKIVASKGPFDVIHGHSSKGGALSRLLPGSIKGTRIYTPHAFRVMDPKISSSSKILYNVLENLLGRISDGVILGSDQEYEIAHKIGINQRKLFHVDFAIADAPLQNRDEVRRRLGFNEEDLLIGFVGRLVSQKAPERAIHALSSINSKFAKLVFIGEGPLMPDLRKLSQSLSVENRVVFLGQLPGMDNMPAFDVMLFPSRYESFGYVFLESAAARVPMVASPVGVAPMIVSGTESGVIVENTDNPEPWANALNTYLDRPQSDSIHTHSINKTTDRTISAMTDQVIDIYENATKMKTYN